MAEPEGPASHSPLKILHVSTRYPPGPGGVERHVREVVRRQRAGGLDARVISSDLYTEIPFVRLPEGSTRRWTEVEGVPVLRWPARALPGDLHYPFLPGLYRKLRQERPSLVHVHTYGTYQGFSATTLRKLNGVPWVLSAHFHPTWSIWGGPRRKSLRRLYDRYLSGPVVRSASRVIVQTQEEERLLREVVEPPGLVRIPPGYTPLPSPREEGGGFRGRYGIPGPFVLFVGRLASNKGLATLLRAFAEVAASRKELSLVLVGEDGGEARPTLEEAARLSLRDRVRWVGFVPEDALLASAYAQAECFVLPSEYEAFGLVLVEALAQGTAVLASRVGGMSEIVEPGRNGELVPPADPPSLARALEELLSDPKLARAMGRWGRENTVPRYRWENVVQALGRLYQEVLDERGRPR